MKDWKKFDFKEMFKNQIGEFSKKIASFIKNMKDFGKLFHLLKIDEIGEVPNDYILELKKRYKELIKTYSEESCPNFFEDSGKLLKLIDKNKLELESEEFLDELKESLNIDKIIKILSNLAKKDDTTQASKKYIANFITEEKNTNSDILVNVINTNENLRRLIFQGMDRYILTEDDIFDIEENEKFIILKGLMDTNIIEKNKNYENESENYIKKTITLLTKTFKKLKQFDIGYRELRQIYD